MSEMERALRDNRVFDRNDTDLYSSWHLGDGGTVTIYVPDRPAIIMTLAKTEELGRDLLRQAEYGRLAALERGSELSPLEEANEANRQLYPQVKGVTR